MSSSVDILSSSRVAEPCVLFGGLNVGWLKDANLDVGVNGSSNGPESLLLIGDISKLVTELKDEVKENFELSLNPPIELLGFECSPTEKSKNPFMFDDCPSVTEIECNCFFLAGLP
ncbi:hypothetical protein WICPIJ_008172 [Wickerhamomyces pijperi]|uniref:Uncharacterized protein n=1 Tax=Wickerhamomyces pijperi TaxID=599730 RepID=A0A9P8PYW0_WICPI|nr:hypothetical protein WICPIJ_008172 [Wickerhamomyces pijperi]